MADHFWRRIALGFAMVTTGTFAGASGVRAEDNHGDVLIRIGDGELRADRLELTPHYMIGVKCAPADGALHAQLPDLPKDQGLLVQEVVPGHAAAKAGIQANDILISAGDKTLTHLGDLSAAIDASKGAELTIKLLRGGKTIGVTVKADEQKLGEPVRVPLGQDRQILEKWMAPVAPDQPLKVQVLRDLAGTHELPDDLSINIFREGKNPAKITVKKGDQKWDANENELAKLPEDVRGHVEQLLGNGPMRVELKDLTLPMQTPIPLGDVLRAPSDIEQRVEKRLDEMNKRLDEMRGAIEQLRNQRQGSGAEKTR